jgi:hypothetical protein
MDNTTQDWFILQGQEQNGWTAIQFKRYFDSCDPMDVPIKVWVLILVVKRMKIFYFIKQSGTNILIFAYGFVDPDLRQSDADIMYHEARRGTRMLPLRSYTGPPADDMLAGLDFFDLRFENVRDCIIVPFF